MKEHICRAHIFVLTAASRRATNPTEVQFLIVNVLNNKDIHDEIHALIDRGA